MSKNYGNDSIRALKGADRIRKRPEVMLSRRDITGARHTVIEMIGNALDEMGAGFGDRLDFTYHADRSVSVRDYGRGVPLGWNEKENRWNWDLIYNEMYAGGKYEDDDISEEVFNRIDVNNIETLKMFTYLFPIGTNGLGGFATQGSSEFFEVCSYHNEVHGDTSTPMVRSRMYFEKGVPVLEELEVTPTTEKRGTYIHWKPDCNEVFTDSVNDDLDFDWILEYCQEIAYIKNYTFLLKDENTGKEYTIEGKGVEELLRKKCGDNLAFDKMYRKEQWNKGLTQNQRKTETVRYLAKAEVVLALTSKKVKTVCYHNSTRMIRGVTYSAIDSAIDTFFTERAREFNVKIRQDDYIDYISAIVCTYSTTTSYENQTKQGVSNLFLHDMIYQMTYEMLLIEYGKGNKELKAIIDDVVNSAVTRAKVAEYEKQVRAASRVSRAREKPENFLECESDDSEITEMWIPEGDSAKNALKAGRSKIFQAILPVRGKVLNCAKASIDKIINCTVIKNIFAVLGCGMDLPGTDLFNINKLRFGKIIIATDADEDGYQIRVLLFLVFYTLAPELLRNGHVYIAETPLFENVLMSGKSVFAFDKEEQNEIEEKYKGLIRVTHRSKGLGENNADMMWDTTMNPETRRLVPLKMDTNDRVSSSIIDCLFGNDRTKSRKSILLDMVSESVEELVESIGLEEEIEIE